MNQYEPGKDKIKDSIRFFLYESGVVQSGGPGSGVTEDELYKSYRHFCLTVRDSVRGSPRQFRAELRDLGFRIYLRWGENGRTEGVYEGVSLKSPEELS